MDLLYFAWVRERIGMGQEQVEPPAEVRSVADLIGWLATRSPGHAEAMRAPERLRAAIDQKFVPLDAPLGAAREVALFPPVTGG
ncbi:molybdopterin synthase sulfur carrier subunit [Sphingomonas naasensis]|uniref:Molybdopterin converting factor subunit 1 n=1 Tax=Sphingomonas naasensis TaxID=1344951 RepID=A0A4S1WC99_9SPHN|nr:molybdopterin converting factor subunit 1 [Sphingomonas naasensis]NIJ19381.1 molybdopterin synthase sulfur carrier subunit [Sphingomonas naasensis]TGX39127.1 molybdopterin converting factor subunit 1 [Sphingomonas naasensis]